MPPVRSRSDGSEPDAATDHDREVLNIVTVGTGQISGAGEFMRPRETEIGGYLAPGSR